jgi:AraC-like DNA-binding protein
MVSFSQEQPGRDLMLQSILYKFLYLLTNNTSIVNKPIQNDMPRRYVEAATKYMFNNYFNDITISEVASHVNVTRAYLFRLFKKYLGTSPQQFLINVRLKKASDLIGNTNLTIGDIARSVGYRDVLLFSKVFKKYFTIPPSQFRKNNSENLPH